MSVGKLLADARNAMTPASIFLQGLREALKDFKDTGIEREALDDALAGLSRASVLIAEAMGMDVAKDHVVDHVRAAIEAHDKARDTPDLFPVLENLRKAAEMIAVVDEMAKKAKSDG